MLPPTGRTRQHPTFKKAKRLLGISGGAPPEIPKSLLAFLKVGCCLVLPVGGSKSQKLKIVTKTKKGFDEQECENVSFVPMLGGTSK